MNDIPFLIAKLKRPLQCRTIDGVDVEYHPDGPFDDLLEEAAEALSRLTISPPPEAAAKELSDWILGFLEDECSLDPSCVSEADRSNIENAIVNTLVPPKLEVSPLPEEIAKLLALREGLPAEPLHADGLEVRYSTSIGSFWLATCSTESVARAIAALHSLFAALQQMGPEMKRQESIFHQLIRDEKRRIREIEAALVSRTAERDAKLDVATKLRVRIRELESERDTALTDGHDRIQELLAEIREIEAERDVARKSDAAKTARVVGLENRLNEIEAERDAVKRDNERLKLMSKHDIAAIKAKTIEECAALFVFDPWRKASYGDVAERIRALNPPEAEAGEE